MTTIYAATADQYLIATILPKIAQNNVNTVRLSVRFDNAWASVTAKRAVFTTSLSSKPYEVILSPSNDCFVPYEVLTETCKLFITIKGTYASGEIKTTTKLTVKVLEGTPVVIVSDSTPNVYEQLVTMSKVLEARMNTFETGSTVEGSEVMGIRTGADGVEYPSAGDAVRAQMSKVKSPLNGMKLVYSNSNCNNLIDKSRIIKGFYVDTTGKMNASADWNLTEPISVVGLSKIYFSGGVGLTCFFDAKGSFISYVQNGSEVTVPANASYLVASIVNSYLTTAMISRHKDQEYDDGFAVIGKKPYQSDFIPFTVAINQTVANNLVEAGVSSEAGEEFVNVDCILSLPTSYTPNGNPSKLLMMCHGAGKGVSEWSAHEGYRAIVKKFVDRGYAVFDCNGFKNDALGWSFWGNSRGVQAWEKAYQYVVNNYNVEQAFSIYAFSMGGLTAMNLAFRNFPNIKCIAMGSPVLNLQACWGDASVKSVLKQLYGLGDSWDDSKVVGCNPYKNIISIDGKKYCFKNLPPIKIWYGSTEQSFGVNKQYAIDMVDAITNSGGSAEYREVNNAGHEICYGQNEYCNIDYLLYIERHNLRLVRE